MLQKNIKSEKCEEQIRDVNNVISEISKYLPDEDLKRLKSTCRYWAPEVRLEYITDFVHRHVYPCSTNKDSIKIYSLLLGVSEEEMLQLMQQNGD